MSGSKLFQFIIDNFKKSNKPRPDTFADIEFKKIDQIYDQLFVDEDCSRKGSKSAKESKIKSPKSKDGANQLLLFKQRMKSKVNV